MYFEKRYLQFNDLVFDGYDMISESSEPVSIKAPSSTAYSYGHGSYSPTKSDYVFIGESQVSMTITLKLKKIPCSYREQYVRFAEQELLKPGKLWAIKNGEIIWTFARVNNINPILSGRRDEVEYDVEFVVPSGVWYKADKQKTFLLPYDVCSLMDCKGFADYNPIANSRGSDDVCQISEDNKIEMDERCGCCCSDEPTADMALGFHLNELQAFYSCDTPYQLKYDCILAEQFNLNPAFGKMLSASKGVISGRFYSDTDLPTDDVVITLYGDSVNPRITINGNTNIIEGEYGGKLEIHANGDVYYSESNCCEPELLDPSVWVIPEGNTYGWKVNPQFNGIVAELNTCDSVHGLQRLYIDHTAITT